MTEQLQLAREILLMCESLTEAETQLARLTPIPTKATRWGLFDGFYGRPESWQDGFSNNPSDKAVYIVGYRLGQQLASECPT